MFYTYSREVVFFASHFNNAEAYKTYENLCELVESNQQVTTGMLNGLLNSCHGHNFTCKVDIRFRLKDGEHYLVADEDIEAIILQFEKRNLSIMPEFKGLGRRVTTELMCSYVADAILNKYNHKLDQILSVNVKTNEHDDRYATYEVNV